LASAAGEAVSASTREVYSQFYSCQSREILNRAAQVAEHDCLLWLAGLEILNVISWRGSESLGCIFDRGEEITLKRRIRLDKDFYRFVDPLIVQRRQRNWGREDCRKVANLLRIGEPALLKPLVEFLF
jgi:hypothetical protein